MNTGKIKAIYLKEMRELIRDKKMMFMIFAMPLLIYPLLIIALSSVLILFESSYEVKEYSVAFDNAIQDERLIDYVLTDRSSDEDAEEKFTFVRVDADDTVENMISNLLADTYVGYAEDGKSLIVYYNSSMADSDHASDYIHDRIKEYEEIVVEEKFTEAGLDKDVYLHPIPVSYENLATDEESMGNVLGMIVPLLLMIGVLMGTMTPAMDITAGEKERGTQETLMTFPITGKELVTGKYLAVATGGAVSAFLYLISVGILGAYIYGVVGMTGEISINLAAFIPALLMVIITVLAFALFLGAVIMCICGFSKSSKEAQSYISPLMVVVMLISYAGYLDVHLTITTSIIPVYNIVLLIKSVLAFEFDVIAILMVLLSNIIYAIIAIMFLGSIYTSERVLFGENEGSLLDRNSVREKGSLPKWSDGLLVILVAIVLFIYIGSLLQLKSFLIGTGLAQLLLLGVAVFAVWFGRTDFKATFSLNRLKLKDIAATILVAVGGYIFVNLACVPLQFLMEDSVFAYTESIEMLMGEQGLFLTWLVIGVAPAICEEALFRGYFLGSLKRIKPVWYILITAFVFGLYHMNLFQSTYAFLLGIVLAFIVYKTGSIAASALTHCICNSISVFISFYPDKMSKVLPYLAEGAGNGTVVVCAIVGAIIMAAGLIWLSFNNKASK